jgi:hypothetical protein
MLPAMRSTKEQQWAKRVAAWRRSGLTSEAFSRRRDFSAGGLRYWASRLRKPTALQTGRSDRSKRVSRPRVRLARVVRESRPYRDAWFVASAWCAAFVWTTSVTLAGEAPTEDVFRKLQRDPSSVSKTLRLEVNRLAQEHQFFHWHLAFPQVFEVIAPLDSSDDSCGWMGGFDVIVGNPPWGQKTSNASGLPWDLLRLSLPSVVGIEEYCRPFIEQCTRLATLEGCRHRCPRGPVSAETPGPGSGRQEFALVDEVL